MTQVKEGALMMEPTVYRLTIEDFYNTPEFLLEQISLHYRHKRRTYYLPPTSNSTFLAEELLSKSDSFHTWYLDEALVTWSTLDTASAQVAHAALGLVGEIAELESILMIDSESIDSEELSDELGDVLYYRFVLQYLSGESLSISSSPNYYNFHTIYRDISAYGKRTAYYRKFTDTKTQLQRHLGMQYVDALITSTLVGYNLSLEEVCENNIRKLRKRHQFGGVTT